MSGADQVSGQEDQNQENQNREGQEDQVMLPETGGAGEYIYTLGGLMLIILSALMYGFLSQVEGREVCRQDKDPGKYDAD